MGQTAYQIIKNAQYLREEDYIPSIFSFRKDSVPLDKYLNETFNAFDTKTQQSLKKRKQVGALEGIAVRVKVRKALCNVVHLLSQPYSDETRKALLQQIEIIRNRLPLIRETLSLGADVSTYESKTAYSHIKAVMSKRAVPTATASEGYDFLENMLFQIDEVLKLPFERNLLSIIDNIDTLVHRNPKNTVVRSYLEQNLFSYNPLTYFNTIPLLKVIKGHLGEMYPGSEFESKDNEVVSYFEYVNQIVFEYIVKMLRGNFR
jgi:hypothetical protein